VQGQGAPLALAQGEKLAGLVGELLQADFQLAAA